MWMAISTKSLTRIGVNRNRRLAKDVEATPKAASETQNESLGRAHDEAPKLLTIARLILKQQTD